MRYIETIKIKNGALLNLRYHQLRIFRTVGVIFDLEVIVPNEFHCGVVKYRVVYDERGIIERTFSHYTLPIIRTLQMVECSEIDYRFKYEDRSAIEHLISKKGDCDDVMILKNGTVTDSSFCNIVFEHKGVLSTPKQPLLKGTKRQLLLDSGIIEERDIDMKFVAESEHIYLVNAMIDLYELKVNEIKKEIHKMQ